MSAAYLIDADMTFVLWPLLQKFFVFLDCFFFDCYLALHSFDFLLAFLQGSLIVLCLLDCSNQEKDKSLRHWCREDF